MSSSNNRVFIIGQVGKPDSAERRRADEIYEYIITPLLGEYNLDPYRADLDPAPGRISVKLLQELLSARLVLADLTGRNANVFYELGIVHAFARPLICLADSPDELPFDTKDERIVPLGEQGDGGLTFAQGEKVKNDLRKSLAMILKEDYEVPTPLRGVAEIRSLDALAKTDPVAAELSAIREAVDSVKEAVTERQVRVPLHLRAEQEILRRLVASAVSSGDYWVAVAMAEVGLEGTSREFRQWLEVLVAEQAAKQGGKPAPNSRSGYKDLKDAQQRMKAGQRPAEEWSAEPPF